jgi:hypothetical protein
VCVRDRYTLSPYHAAFVCSENRVSPARRLAPVILAAIIAPAAFATGAELCPATPPTQPAAYVAHINEVNRGLGIPDDYAAQHNLVPQPEAKHLVDVPRDVSCPGNDLSFRTSPEGARSGIQLLRVA